jgi:Winged helix DNA-binding domain
VTDLAPLRMRAQRLVGEPCPSTVDAVRWLGAVQSQDYGGAKWALAQRTPGATDVEIDHLFDEGAILRTHVMRPTWHFVLPEDIRWLLELTGRRVGLGLAARHRQLEIDGRLVARACDVFAAALAGGRHLTRPELGGALLAAGISAEGQRLPHLIMAAELEGLIASGPRHGKQHTYALLAERAPEATSMGGDEALGELARRYFRSHGPAQVQDFVWWSGLTMAEARAGVALAGDALDRLVVEGADYWLDPEAGPGAGVAGCAHLLPNFDEYTVAYRDRAALHDPEVPVDPRLFSFGSILSNVLTVGGRVRGAWRRTAAREGVRVEVRLLGPLDPGHRASVEEAGRRYARFLESRVKVDWLP